MTKHADRDHSEPYWPPTATREPRVRFPLDDGDTGASLLPVVPAGTLLRCPVCPAALADTRGGRLDHCDDGSHHYVPAQPVIIPPIPRPCRGCGVGEAQQHIDDCPVVIEAVNALPSAPEPSQAPESHGDVERIDKFAQAIFDEVVDHPMWIGDDGEPLDYLPERATRLTDFIYEAAAAVMAVADAERAEVGA